MTSIGEQTWFRSGDRTLEGWVHRPDDGRAVGAVVIAGPFAHEAIVAQRAIRVLAVEAARRGFVAVRFSWSGTGDSEAAPEGTDLAASWQEDLAAAAALARTASGFAAVDAIGVRFGAAVVTVADVPLRRRVLWNPLGGRAFLRMQSSLLRFHLPEGFPLSTQGVELCGYTLDDGEAASLRALQDPRASASHEASDESLVIVEDDTQTVAELFGREPFNARVPLPSIEKLIGALDRVSAVPLPTWVPKREQLLTDASGRRLRQTLLELGPDRLPGILTEPMDGPAAEAAAVFIPFGNEAKGAARLGRATSMRLAAGGIPTLRADRRGIGDAGDPDVLDEPITLHDAAVDDVAQFASWLTDRTGAPIIGVGLCSGAWLVARAAAKAPFQRLILVNNLSWNTRASYYVRLKRLLGAQAEEVKANPSATGSAARFRGIGRRLKRLFRSRAPYMVRYRLYSLFNRDEIAETLLTQVPEQTSVSLLFGTDGDRGTWESARGPTSVRRLRRRGRRIEVDYDRRTDHALMSSAGFESYLELLDREFDLHRLSA